MYELMLMRHAKSDWQGQVADFDRPLNGRGRRDAMNMGIFLSQKNIVPDRMVVSPAQRTRETASLLLENMSVDSSNIVFDNELYLADRETLCDIIEAYAVEGRRLLVLAHNPGMDYMVEYLSNTALPLTSDGKLMTTCAVACFSMDSVDVLKKPAQGKFQNLFRAKDISDHR
jgi:phosphohistidine phosphatase